MQRSICPIAALNVYTLYTPNILVFINITDSVIIINSKCGKFQTAYMNFVDFQIYVHTIITNEQ